MRRQYRSFKLRYSIVVVTLGTAAMAPLGFGAPAAPDVQAAIQRLQAEAGGAAEVALNRATGAARFVRLPAGSVAAARALGPVKVTPEHLSSDFLRAHGALFGIRDAAGELTLVRAFDDDLGERHLVYQQTFEGLPVFGGELRSHVASDELRVVNGVFVPDIAVDAQPSRAAESVAKFALGKIRTETSAAGLYVAGQRLLVYREGLVKGTSGETHLAWELEVTNGKQVREFVYMDAHTGKFIDQITGVQDALSRRAFDALGAPAPGPNYPFAPYWVEGDPFPTSSTEANNMLAASGETYNLFFRPFNRDSFDGAGATMDSIFNRGDLCPNASWNGTFISFCPGTTADDVTAHEWGHAYTEFTHHLIYQWQSGALNESYSDIWGEMVDQLNGRQTDSPNTRRTAGACSAFTTLPPVLHVNTPAEIAGDYAAGAAQFGAPLSNTGLTSDMVLVDDGVGNATPPSGAGGAGDLSVMDACETPFANAAAIAGKIAMVYRGNCTFPVKVKNAQLAGAIGVVVANHAVGGDALVTMAGVDATITIPSLFVGNSNGELVRARLGTGVNVTLRRGSGQPIDNSLRWLIGEDATAFGGAIRDMWNPTCHDDPGKVSDAQYTCSVLDNGGVHTNSGVPNHAYALLVDGGTYNGQAVGAIGMTKAAHIYVRASTVYQHPISDFADHADAIEQSCRDLVGKKLASLRTGAPSDQVITTSDCGRVMTATAAVELRTPPAQCNFQPILAKNPPPVCPTGTAQVTLLSERFESGAPGWTVTHDAVSSVDFTPRDWQIVSALPHNHPGSAMFAVDPRTGTCGPGGDESGVLHLTSPVITLPNGVVQPLLTFEHWVATEAGWDGGNLKVSVNGGPWQVVAPTAYTFNPYNRDLFATFEGSTNPMAGEPAFSGIDEGSVSGSWGVSRVQLAGYATAGDTVQLRYDFGTDGCGGAFGWYVTDVAAYACASTAPPAVSVNDFAVTEGQTGLTDAKFTISLSSIHDQPVSVSYATSDGTARLNNSDYLRATGVAVIGPGSISADVITKVVGDRRREPNETFNLNLLSTTRGTLVDRRGVCTIVNDDF